MGRPLRLAIAVLLSMAACRGGSPPDDSGGWQSLASMDLERTEVAAGVANGRIHVVGGFTSDGVVAAVEVYDPATDSWNRGPDLPTAIHHAMAVGIGDVLYVFGGYLGSGFNRPSDLGFALREGRWEELPRLPQPRAAGGAAALDGVVYVVGGVGDRGPATTTLVFDTIQRSWSTTSGLMAPREHLGVATDGSVVYAVGGRLGGIGTNLNAVEVFDPATGVWSAGPSLLTARGGSAAAATASGSIVTAGGEADRSFDSAEMLAAGSQRWQDLPPMPTARHGLGLVAIGDVVYALAGGPRPGFAFSAAVESIQLPAPGAR